MSTIEEVHIPEGKRCSKCHRFLPFTEFHPSVRDGFRSRCKMCHNEENREYRRTIRGRQTTKAYREGHKQELSEYGRNWREENKERKREMDRAYREQNWEKIRHLQKECGKTPEGIYRRILWGAKRRNIVFDIEKEDFCKWYVGLPKICEYCEIEQNLLSRLGERWTRKYGARRLTIDRKDNTAGYTLDNIVLSCYECNRIKGSRLTYDEMLAIGDILRKKWMTMIEVEKTTTSKHKKGERAPKK